MTTKTVEPKAPSQLIGVEDGAKMLGIAEVTLRLYAYKGRIASVKLGTRLMFQVSELERLIAENTRPRFTPSPGRSSKQMVS